jgi:heterodisulfide reductase subunit D
MPALTQESKATRSWACYDCGKCTATCPIARVGGDYSPRRQVLAANAGNTGVGDLSDTGLFTCLTCSQCERRCPAAVGYTDLVRTLRETAFREGVEPECPHGGALQSVMRMMASGGTRQDRLGWIGDELRTEPETGKVFYWTGCAMYLDAFFPELGVSTLDGARAAVKVMNALGVEPVVSAAERCCGHDLLWNGDRRSFDALARHNVSLVAASGAETMVTSCAECLRTWKLDYARFFEGKPPRMLHTTEFLMETRSGLRLKIDGERRVTFQDPCRLGRHLGIYDPPRQLLQAIPGVSVHEMRRSGPGAVCCAGGTWSHCDRFAKAIQVDRLREARDTGAELLVTACPKCQVHFRCAMNDPNLAGEISMEMRDVTQLVADALE